MQVFDNVNLQCTNKSLNESYVCSFNGLYYNKNMNSTASAEFKDLNKICVPSKESILAYFIRMWKKIATVITIISMVGSFFLFV